MKKAIVCSTIVGLLFAALLFARTRTSAVLELAQTFTASKTFNDSIKIIMGTGSDAEVYFDATDLVLDPDVAGSGKVRFKGATRKDNQAATVDSATTFAATSDYITLACTGAETINTITGGSAGQVVLLENTDTDCTLADDDDPTAADALDLTGAATNDVGAVAKVLTLVHNGTHWKQAAESDN